MSPEIVGAGGLVLAALVAGVTGYLTSRYQTKAHEKKQSEEFVTEQLKVLYAESGKFWDERAASLTNEVQLERTAREASVAKVNADLALVTEHNAQLQRAIIECEDRARNFERRLKMAGESLANGELRP